MIIIPAIDIKDGKVVRLHQGRFDKVTEYSTDPVEAARRWQAEGASRLHVVDLDGAFAGAIKNFATIAKITKSVTIPVQVGGGIRTEDDIAGLLDAGVSYVILGTKVVENRSFLAKILKNWNEQIIVSLDCADGMVAQRGWTSTSQIKGTDFARELQKLGVRCLVYTDIARDGTLSGPNFDGIRQIMDVVKISVIASGGIADLDDIKKLCELESKGLTGAITGKAIYDGRLDLKEAIKYAQQKNHSVS